MMSERQEKPLRFHPSTSSYLKLLRSSSALLSQLELLNELRSEELRREVKMYKRRPGAKPSSNSSNSSNAAPGDDAAARAGADRPLPPPPQPVATIKISITSLLRPFILSLLLSYKVTLSLLARGFGVPASVATGVAVALVGAYKGVRDGVRGGGFDGADDDGEEGGQNRQVQVDVQEVDGDGDGDGGNFWKDFIFNGVVAPPPVADAAAPEGGDDGQNDGDGGDQGFKGMIVGMVVEGTIFCSTFVMAIMPWWDAQ